MAKARQAKKPKADVVVAGIRPAADALLRESEERFRAIVNSANEGILVYDRDLQITSGNLAAERIIGLPLSHMVGRAGFTSLLPCVREDGAPLTPDERPTRITFRSGLPLTDKVIGIKRADRSVTWLSINTAFLRRPGEVEFYGIVSTLADITAKRHAEAALRESEERFRQTFELAGSGIAHVGLDGRYLRVNRKLCDILGYAENELIGRSVKDLSHPDDRDVTDPNRKRMHVGEFETFNLQKRYLHKDGHVVWVDLTVAAARDAGGKAHYEIALYDDITERRRAEEALRESEERFRSLTQLSSDWYWEQDEEFRLKFMSVRMAERTGLAPSAYLGRKRWDRPALNLTEADWDAHRAQLNRHESFREFEMLRLGDDGRRAWVSLSGEPIFDASGRFTGYRGVGRDITGRKEAEAELRRAHDELSRSNSELEQFAYVASHDLQEPLRMVSSYTQLLVRRYGDKLDADSREFMGYIVDGATRMKQLIEDLLAYSRVGTKGKEMRPVSLEAPLRRAITNVRGSVEEAGAAITYDPLPEVKGDEMQLAQLFQNLLGNALKFRSASVPRIHVSSKEQENEWEVTVADNGIGIEPQYFERIFMVFQRLHNKDEYPGTGIGLAICKKVIERHGGHMRVSSAPGEGSSFHFTLPKMKESA
jgi:PAS domain S-box-containing protein